MIELLYSEENSRLEYRAAYRKIERVRRKLQARLDAEGQALLEEFERLYIRQTSLELQDTFADGFSAAVTLLLEALDR